MDPDALKSTSGANPEVLFLLISKLDDGRMSVFPLSYELQCCLQTSASGLTVLVHQTRQTNQTDQSQPTPIRSVDAGVVKGVGADRIPLHVMLQIPHVFIYRRTGLMNFVHWMLHTVVRAFRHSRSSKDQADASRQQQGCSLSSHVRFTSENGIFQNKIPRFITLYAKPPEPSKKLRPARNPNHAIGAIPTAW